MGMFDTIHFPCPECGEDIEAQSKGGNCDLSHYDYRTVPIDVMQDANRHAPFTCKKCGRDNINFRIPTGHLEID